MKITTEPAGRFGWQGDSLHYVVKAEGASELSLPEKAPGGVQMRLTGVRQVGDGVEGRLTVDVKDSTFV
ncbi:MAG: hypothetical protein C4521_01985 [Actinobacteria bacterium]|nr:MAG: hypothetical protein C4521_01985 [Actinomycetota bacterium]